MKRFLIIWAFLGWAAAGAAWAAESPLEDDVAPFKAEQEDRVVIAASKYLQPAGEAPASVTIVAAEEIRRYGWRTLADVFRSVRGFYVSDDRNYSYLGVRGFSRPGDFNVRILGLLNGHTLNDDIYQAFLLGRESGIDLDRVDRIEIVRGPGAALYGTSAFFAVVNIVTQEGGDLQGFETLAEAGSFNTNKGILTYGRRHENGLDILFNASYARSGGQTLFFPEYDDGNPVHNAGFAEHADGESVYSFFGAVGYNDLRFQGIYFDRRKAIPTASYASVFNDGREATGDERYFIELKYSPQLTQSLGLMIRAYDDGYRYRATYPYDYPPLTLNRDDTPGRWYGYVGDRERFELYSVYLQDEMRLRRGLTLTAGYQYKIRNLINLADLGGNLIGFENLNRVRGAGIEPELAAKWPSGVEAYIGYTYQVTKDLDTREELSNSPRHLAKAGLFLPLSFDGASAGILDLQSL